MDSWVETLIKRLQGDIPLVTEPFAEIAQETGRSQQELIGIITRLKQDGVIRRFGAILGHRQAGFAHNVLVMWEIPENMVDEAGKYMASFREISHCYLRETPDHWPYNMYTMIHGRSEEDVNKVVADIAARFEPSRYRLVRSVREFKKTSMTYY
ncbi:MAG TPA: Lrp/AsnC family transcriptional regulator [Syntrophothermus lipocalidus]|uniref:siroheme decarboxylase n=1 Tax=Syntrophothermus lipocalidus (strain DSM 12680 / TGB-C1) TaxID=643648 RepID=D7CN99_SYNLT|nr:Lrp/AsnC family transcriptional regulator [Syntrophothermus lipocalidus]ADI02184.1 putative transcriptional regulator, AsnC family [Syntrophothermus lipocalidus DSM 12680]HHV75973.1 Lrp/AsnC family transcriptional regulator [Syntrophothermus lipocalidus]HOV42711.1 Lrp/AsnC family transcriptional regulator [Syntrophothermus lipocalidus]